MDYYQDITLLPDAEVNLGFLWQKVFQQVHIALVEHKVADNRSAIALSIPKYKRERSNSGFPLGSQLRLIGTKQALEKLEISLWLSRLMDYVHIKSIKAVPDDVNQFACFRRKHVVGAAGREKKVEQKAKHISGKFGVEFSEVADKQLSDSQLPTKGDITPYIRIARNKADDPFANSFPLFISMVLVDKAMTGEFNCYGLSSLKPDQAATVPWF